MEALHATWGKRWTDQVAGVAYAQLRAQWGAAMSGWTKADARDALAYCRDRMTWPPSIAEFVQARNHGFTREQQAQYARLARADAAQRALPAEPWADVRARGASRIAEIKQQIAGAR